LTKAEREEQQAVLRRLRGDAAVLAARFALRLTALEPERPQVKRRYGICYSDGTIRIRLRHVTTGRLLKYSSLVNTLCHELAHLRYFNHGARFQALYGKILEYARHRGFYQPRGATPLRGPTPPRLAPRPGSIQRDREGEALRAPTQLELF
jgi:predicted metal-dependent hydrolase